MGNNTQRIDSIRNDGNTMLDAVNQEVEKILTIKNKTNGIQIRK